MSKSYFLKRYLATLQLAEQAKTETERKLHLRNLRYYQDLIALSRDEQPRNASK